jgi:RNA polymerase sigma-70 factor (ECF subfamily)
MRPESFVTHTAASDAAERDADVVALIRQDALHAAFDTLLTRYETKVFHLCVAMLGDTGQAQEVAQDSLLRIWRSLSGYDAARGAISTWVYAITRNRCLTELGQQRHTAEISIELSGVREEAESVADDASLQDRAAHRLLHAWVDALPPMQRACLKLYYFEEQSVAEVASNPIQRIQRHQNPDQRVRPLGRQPALKRLPRMEGIKQLGCIYAQSP